MHALAERGPYDEKAGAGLIQVKSNEQLDQEEAERERELAAEATQARPEITALAGHIRRWWTTNKQAHQDVEARIRKSKLAKKGKYSPEDLEKIRKTKGSEVYINITGIKCWAAESWLYDIMLPPGERPWAASPTPVPELPPDVVQKIEQEIGQQYMGALQVAAELQGSIDPAEVEQAIEDVTEAVRKEIKAQAEKSANILETEIDDDLVEGGWYEAIKECIPDIVDSPAGIVCGPIVRMEKQLEWTQGPNGLRVANVVEKPTRTYSRRNPLDIYPSPGAKSLQEGVLIDLLRLEARDFQAMIGVEGFDDDSVRYVLKHYGANGHREVISGDTERSEIEDKPTEMGMNEMGLIDTLKFMGPVQGLELLKWGMDDSQVPDPLKFYEVTAYLVDHIVIGARINQHPLGRRPYYSASYINNNDSVWGRSVPEIMEDIQRICNGAGRAMVNNLAHASGPSVWGYSNRFADGMTPNIIPWKFWGFKTEAGDNGTRPPMGFFQPKSNAQELILLFDHFYRQASEVTGIPAYVYGSDSVRGAGETASGLSMLMNAASKGLKKVAGHIDTGIVKPSIEEHWLSIMLKEPEKAQGDIQIQPRASEYLLIAEQLQIRRGEFLDRTNNPTDIQIIGQGGRAEVLKEYAKSLKMNSDRIVPDREDILESERDNAIQLVVQRIATVLGLPPDQLMLAAQGQPPAGVGVPGAAPGPASAGLLPNGAPAGGEEQVV